MQKIFIVKESTVEEGDQTLQRVNDFIGINGKIISLTPFGVGVTGVISSNSVISSPHRVAGRILVVADNCDGIKL